MTYRSVIGFVLVKTSWPNGTGELWPRLLSCIVFYIDKYVIDERKDEREDCKIYRVLSLYFQVVIASIHQRNRKVHEKMCPHRVVYPINYMSRK